MIVIFILAMIGASGYLSYLVAEMRYSLPTILLKAAQMDFSGINWLKHNFHYFWLNVALAGVVICCLYSIALFIRI